MLSRIDDEVLRRMNDDWIRLEIDSHVAIRHVVAGLDGIVTSLSARPVGGGIDYDCLKRLGEIEHELHKVIILRPRRKGYFLDKNAEHAVRKRPCLPAKSSD